MTILLSILKILGVVLLVLAADILVILILLMIVPFRYRLQAEGGSSETYGLEEKPLCGSLRIRWLSGAVSAKGDFCIKDWSAVLDASVRVFGIPVYALKKGVVLTELFQKDEKKSSDSDSKSGSGSGYIKKYVKGILKEVVPRDGHLKVWFGLGDPYATSVVLGAAAFFYGLCRGRIELIPDMSGSSLYADGWISGRLRIIAVLLRK